MEEAIVIPFIVLSFVLLLVWMMLSYFKWKQQHAAGPPPGSSLKTSELQALMRAAVEEANAPLVARIEALEHRIAAPALPPRHAERELESTR